MSNNALGLYLYELRSREKLSMRQLDELAGVTVYYISYLESGKRTNPSMQVMARLFKALNMSKEEIEHFLDLYAIQNGCVRFNAILNQFRQYYGLLDYDLKMTDRYLWQLGKAAFPREYK